jgi:uncharacterized protein (TIGR02271 family)
MAERTESGHQESSSVVRHEEEVELGSAVEEGGAVQARKRVETERGEQVVPRRIEHVDDLERTAPAEGDSGEVEVLPDGSISIPVFEEELVVTKRLVVRERVVIRKRTQTEQRRVAAELRKERVEVEAEGDVEIGGEAST